MSWTPGTPLRREDVELLVDVWIVAALARFVLDPLARRLERRERVPELVDRRLRVDEAPDQDADDDAAA